MVVICALPPPSPPTHTHTLSPTLTLFTFAFVSLAKHAGDGSAADGGSAGGDASSSSSLRLSAGLLAKEILRGAPGHFSGPVAQAVLPVAYAARMDDDADVAAVWREVWDEGVSSEAGALRLYATEVVSYLVAGLGSSQWGRKKAAAAAVARLAEVAGGDGLSEGHVQQLVGALVAEAGGRLWEGKEAVLAALGALAQHCPKHLLLPSSPSAAAAAAAPSTAAAPAQDGGSGKASALGERVLTSLLDAVGRKKASFRAAALSALEVALSGLKTVDVYSRAAPPLLAACRTHSTAPQLSATAAAVQAQAAAETGGGAAGSGGGEAVAEETKPLPLVESLKCLAAAWEAAGPATHAASGQELAEVVAGVLESNQPWQSRLAALHVATRLIKAATAPLPAAAAAGSAGASSLAGQWVQRLVPGVLACLDLKVQQLRSAALDTCLLIVSSTTTTMTAATRSNSGLSSDGAASATTLPGAHQQLAVAEPLLRAMHERAAAVAVSAEEPSVAIKAAAAKLADALAAQLQLGGGGGGEGAAPNAETTKA